MENQTRSTRSLRGSPTCWTRRKSRRRSALRMGPTRMKCRWNMQQRFVTYFQNSVQRCVSVHSVSGDNGVGHFVSLPVVRKSTRKCRHNSLTNRHGFAGPWITSVGGTTSLLIPEVAANLSMGGFSILFPHPEYQEAAVPVFL